MSIVVWCLLWAFAAPLATLAASVYSYLRDAKHLRRFPSPSVAAFTPLWAIWHNARGRRYLTVEDAHRRLGPVVRIGPNSLSFADCQAYKEIYGHGSPIIKDLFYDNLAGNTPSMADTTSRQLHSIKRRNVSSVFSAKNISALEPKVQRTVSLLLHALTLKSSGWAVSATDRYPVSECGEFDLRPWMNMFSFDAFSSMLWSLPYGFLERGNDDCPSMDINGQVTTVQAMHDFQTGVHFNTVCAQLPPPMYRFVRRITRWMPRTRSADKFAGMARYGTVQRLQHGPDGVDFFSFFPLEATEKRPMPMSAPDLVAECTSFLNAGNDTTQISLTNIMYQLITHPRHLTKLHGLLVANLPDEMQPIAASSALNQIPYLTACINETLRLMPPVRFGLPRRTVGDGSVIRGHHIPGGVTVSASVQTMQCDPALFHKPLEFIPERWLPGCPDAVDNEANNLKDYVLPFTLGGRACIGRNLAYMEVSICLAALVMAFEWNISAEAARSFTHFERMNTSPLSLMVTASPRPKFSGAQG